MEFTNFLKLLFRHKATLILVPLITVIGIFFLVRNMPDVYTSRSRLSTGIVDKSDALIANNDYVQESKTTQEFSNLIEMILLKKMINQISYQLIIHDLTNNPPFRKPGAVLAKWNEDQKKRALEIFTQKYNDRQELEETDSTQQALFKLLKSMKYDEESIRKKLSVYRVNNSDFIDLKFDSENPMLSAFLLNTLCKEFISYYSTNMNENKSKAIAFLDSMMTKKQEALRAKMQALQNYKVKNGVLDVNDQGTSLIGQIAEFEAKKQEAQKNINAYSGALQNIDSKFNPNDRKYLESSLTEINQNINTTRNRLASLNDE
jgi:uncharacterized protein involved in exopolysaccharide biosynthesis